MNDLPINISELRENYAKGSLSIEDVSNSPFDQFNKWFAQAVESKLQEPNAMVLSTIDEAQVPDARVVLLKGITTKGFLFYTNYESQKGKQLAFNPNAALTFLWLPLERQIRLRGKVSRLSEADSTAYFQSRPKSSQIGAWVSMQSETLENRAIIEEKQSYYEQKFEGEAIPKPPFWGGYVLEPTFFEFWQGRPSRLHDRIQYIQNGNDWEKKRVYP